MTYNSGDDIVGLLESIEEESADLEVAVVVVDNDSVDDTMARARSASPRATVVDSGGNLGYAAAINVGLAELDGTRPVLVLNPDGRVETGALRTLLTAAAEPGVGAVVPRIVDDEGELSLSIRREPSILGTLGDGLLGHRLPGRPGSWSETVLDRGAYEHRRDIDWATGAAILIQPAAMRDAGAWDEQFFLYSEETDYLRRVRDAGWIVRYIPEATITHGQGGSGFSPRLNALGAVNQVRYVRKHHSRPYAAVFRAAAVVAQVVRVRRPENALALRFLLRERMWGELPQATRAHERG